MIDPVNHIFKAGDILPVSAKEELEALISVIKGLQPCTMCDLKKPKCNHKCNLQEGVYFKYRDMNTKEIIPKVSNEVEHPNHYQMFGVEVEDIIWFIVGHEKNKDKTPKEIACIYAEVKYRLRAGFKTEDFTIDMQKAMDYFKKRS
jgi:hypothetical protein